MQHLDEGTIHTWLDGALNADEASRVEQHAAQCAHCAALVAEARGLVAASSRVLSALDDVPAMVPREAPTPGVASIASAPAAQRRRSRSLLRSRWVAAAASVVLMAGTVYVWNETGGPSDRMMESSPVSRTMPANQSADSAPAQVAAGADAVGGPESARAQPPVSYEQRGAAARAPAPSTDGARAEAMSRQATAQVTGRERAMDERSAANRAERAATDRAERVVTERALVPADSTARKLASAVEPPAVAPSVVAPPTAARRAAAPAASRAATVGAAASRPTDTVFRTRIDTVTIVRADTILVDAPEPLPALRGAPRRAVATPLYSLSGCYEVTQGGLPRFVTLDTARVAGGTGVTRFAARAPGVTGYWTSQGTSGVQLVMANSSVEAALDPATGGLRGTARRGGMTTDFVARRGCR